MATRVTSNQGHARKSRDGKGRYVRSIETAERDAEACRLRADGFTYDQIATQMGYSDRSLARRAVERALTSVVAEPTAEVRALELLRLDQALQRLAEDEEKVRAVRDREHLTVSHGRVIYVDGDDGTQIPLIDDGPVLQANAQLMAIEDRRRHIQERRAKYLGLDAPAKVAMLTDDDLDRAEQQLRAELAELDAAAAATDRDDPEVEG